MAALKTLRAVLPRGNTLPRDIARRRHRALLWLLWAHAALMPVYAMLEGFSPGHALFEGSLIAVPALAATFAPGPRLRAAFASVGLLVASSLLVHLSGGVIEAHFHFFVMVLILTVYEDWVPLGVAVGYVLLHHGVIGTLDPASVYNHGDARENPWAWALIHAGFVLAATVAGVMGWRMQEHLREVAQASERRFRTLATKGPAAIFQTDELGRCLFVNARWEQVAGIGSEEALQRPWYHAVHRDDRVRVATEWERAIEGLEDFSSEFRLGAETWVAGSGAALHDDEGNVTGYIGSCLDITRARQAADELARAERLYRNLIERAPAITYVSELGEKGHWAYVSPYLETLLGYTAEEWQRDPGLWFSRIHPEDRERVASAEREAAASRTPLAVEYRIRARDGHLIWLRDEAAFKDEESNYAEGLMVDITDRKIMEERLRYLATHDQMTGLLNRHHFEKLVARQLELEQRYGHPSGALLVLDLDDFKQVNDNFGHQAGDEVLSAVAGVLRQRLRDSDIIGRLGGDEFGAYLPEIDHEAAATVAGELSRALRERRVSTATATTGAEVSIGISCSTDVDDDVDALLAAADASMYRAKASRRGGRETVRVREPEPSAQPYAAIDSASSSTPSSAGRCASSPR